MARSQSGTGFSSQSIRAGDLTTLSTLLTLSSSLAVVEESLDRWSARVPSSEDILGRCLG